MPRWTERRLVVGHGGRGRTTAVREWADDAVRNIDGAVAWIRGSFEQHADPEAASSSRARADAIATIEAAGALAVDDAHWLPDDVVDALVARSSAVPVCASRAAWPDSSSLQHLDDALTVRDPAIRLTAMSTSEIAAAQESAGTTDVPTEVLALFTGGSSAITRLCIEHRWTGDSNDVPPAVVDAVIRLARQSGHDVVRATQLMALGLRLDDAIAAARPDRDDTERRLRVSGLVDGDRLLQVVTAACRLDLTRSDRETLAESVSTSGVSPSADVRAQIDLTNADPALQAAAAFRLGAPDAERLIERASATGADDRTGELLFGTDMRAMRWQEAAAVVPSGPLRSLAEAFAADFASPPETDGSRDVLHQTWTMISEHASGASDNAVAIGADVTERAQSLDFDRPTGWSPASISALIALASGDARTARTWALAAVDANASGDGEQRCHRLIAALAGIAVNEFSEALDLVRQGAGQEWPRRDRFLLAAIDAAIARRSGDTTRLRNAWQQCEPLLVGQPVSWLLYDPLLEVLCAGTRLGDARRVSPVVDRLLAQLGALPHDGPGTTAALWLGLHLAISSDDWPSVDDHGQRFAGLTPTDARSTARVAAGRAWQQIANVRSGRGSIDLAAVDLAVDRLVAVDDAWEASRLLGQAALDHDDVTTARTLLERARHLITDPVETADALLAAGLSEREAEVARLVAEGRTYKDIGAQLFISAKTVEHHVARIRQRLGAGSRAEMLSTIREMS